MGLRESPYSNRFLGALDTLARDILFPSCWLTSQLLALKQTTAEEEQRRRCPYALEALLKGLLILPLLILSAPFSLLAFLVWLPLQAVRRPFAYQHTPSPAPPGDWVLSGRGSTLSFITSNLCLLPDGLAKFSNLSQTQWRAKRIAQSLAKAARRPSRGSLQNRGSSSPGKQKYGATESSPLRPSPSPPCDVPDVVIEIPQDAERKTSIPSRITARFPPSADFVCLQEVFDQEASTHVRRILGPCYEHIIYDVGSYGLTSCGTLKVFNSGLFLASRYPVLAAQYHCYPDGRREDAFSAKGLLCVQVQLGTSQGKRVVGYLSCTHMQATEADAQVRCEQLTLSLLWAQQFQDETGHEGDIVAFDVYCGDLNFDNCSSACEMEQAHEIFRCYTDPCRIGPRKDQPWAIGTLLNYLELYKEAVSKPESMKRTLEQSEGRKKYLARPILSDGSPDLSAACPNGRRIDYILYREHHVELRTVVEEVSFVTQLATCSDHLPVGLRLLVAPSAQAEA